MGKSPPTLVKLIESTTDGAESLDNFVVDEEEQDMEADRNDGGDDEGIGAHTGGTETLAISVRVCSQFLCLLS